MYTHIRTYTTYTHTGAIQVVLATWMRVTSFYAFVAYSVVAPQVARGGGDFWGNAVCSTSSENDGAKHCVWRETHIPATNSEGIFDATERCAGIWGAASCVSVLCFYSCVCIRHRSNCGCGRGRTSLYKCLVCLQLFVYFKLEIEKPPDN